MNDLLEKQRLEINRLQQEASSKDRLEQRLDRLEQKLDAKHQECLDLLDISKAWKFQVN